MKRAKKFLMLCCFMAMMVGSTLVVGAQERAYIACPSCPNGIMASTSTYFSWTNTGTTRKCTHYT